MWWAWKVNKALATLGVNPNHVNGDYRRAIQELGKRGSYTPEETALWIVSQMPMTYQFNTDEAIAIWRSQGKLDYQKEDVRKAMSNLGYAGFL